MEESGVGGGGGGWQRWVSFTMACISRFMAGSSNALPAYLFDLKTQFGLSQHARKWIFNKMQILLTKWILVTHKFVNEIRYLGRTQCLTPVRCQSITLVNIIALSTEQLGTTSVNYDIDVFHKWYSFFFNFDFGHQSCYCIALQWSHVRTTVCEIIGNPTV